MAMKVAKAMLVEVNVTAFWFPPAERTYNVASAKMHRLAIKDSSNVFNSLITELILPLHSMARTQTLVLSQIIAYYS